MSIRSMWGGLPFVRGRRARRGIRERLDALQELRSLGLPPFSDSVLSPPRELLDGEPRRGAGPARLTPAADEDK